MPCKFLSISTFVLSIVLSVSAAGPADPTPVEILNRVDDVHRGASSRGRMTMKVVREHWTRQVKVEFWAEGKEKTLVRILEPQKEQGTATLRVGSEMWNYLPRVNKVIRVPASMLGSSWMGSHFTNDDLMKQSRLADNFDCSETFRGSRNNIQVVEITCVPKPGAAVVWGKVVVVIRSSDWMPLSIGYFDDVMKPARALLFEDCGEMGGRLVPRLVRMIPADKPGEMTEIRYEELSFDDTLPNDMFSLRSLQR